MTLAETRGQAPRPREAGQTAGILWMVAATILYVAMVISVRMLGPGIPTSQSAFMRFAIGLIFLLPVIPQTMRRGFPEGTLKLFAWRGAVHTIGVMFWFYAMVRIPVAETTAIGYLTPILMTAAGAIMFGEMLSGGRLLYADKLGLG